MNMTYWEQGRAAVMTTARFDCPYAIGTDACEEWLAGYDSALEELYN